MNKKLIGILLLLVIVSSQCKKESGDNATAKIDVSNITQTDASGVIIGQADNTDWTEDISWTSDEYNLFQTPPSSQLTSIQTATIIIYPVYPNPLSRSCILSYNASKIVYAEIVITDSMLSVKDRYSFVLNSGVNLLQLNFDDSKYQSNTNYRLYYGFYSATDKLYFKGHGDIKIIK